MKFFFVILVLVNARTLHVVNAEQYVFENIRTQTAVAPENNVFTLEPPPLMQFEYVQEVEQLLINATVTYLGSGDVLYNGELVNVCDNQEANSWANTVVKLFKIILVPRKGRRSPPCPIQPTRGEINEAYTPLSTSLNDKLDSGEYQYSYTAQTDNATVILSSMILTMTLN